MYIGALMPPMPITPMKRPWPIQSGHGSPSVDIASPRPIITEPQMTVVRAPTCAAIGPVTIPPNASPSQASALASADIERSPPASAAMSLRATGVIQSEPNPIKMANSATVATAHDLFVSMEAAGDRMMKSGCLIFCQAAVILTTHAFEGQQCLLHCAKLR